MVSIPAEVARRFGIRPGYKLDWQPVEGKQEILIKIIPDRAELARQLSGCLAHLKPGYSVVDELVRERELEDAEREEELKLGEKY
jgi:hypothetical protein